MVKFNVFYNREEMGDSVFYDEDDWKFEDEEEEVTEEVNGDIEGRKSDVRLNTMERDLFLQYSFNSAENRAHVWNLDTKRGRIRFKIHLIMDHIIVRIFSVLLVLTDIVLVVVSLATKSSNSAYSIITLTIVSYFMLELGLRIFSWGREFFHHRLEIVDMCIILITFTMTVVFELLVINTHAKYGKLIVTFRLLRILMLLRICTGKKHVERSTRNLISQNKRRYVKDGFDLDLTYITDNVIAMSFPSSGKTSLYRNPISEVARFFNTKHPNHYKIYNLCSERSYDVDYFNGQVERVMIDDHNVPSLSQLMQFCQNVDDWMKKNEDNIVAVHCKGGKGRTGSCIAAWLIYSGQFKSAEKALDFFGARRTDRAKGQKYQGVETPSQSRYIHYLEKVLKDMNGIIPPAKPLLLKSLKISGLKNVGNGDGSDLHMIIHFGEKIICEMNFNIPFDGKVKRDHDSMKVKFDVGTSPILCGDIKFKFTCSNSNVPKDYDDCAFFFWFHTSFINNNKLHLARNEIGNCHKKKHHKVYPDKFGITLKFMGAPNDSDGQSFSRPSTRM